MRQQSKVQITVRNRIIGGAQPLICLPLVGEKKDTVLDEARELTPLMPDLLEWRIDAYDKAENIDECLDDLEELRQIIGDIPLIFTCRIDKEGGVNTISQEKRLELYTAVCISGNVDIIDIELCNETVFVDAILKTARANNIAVILSYHNFNETPSQAFMYAKLVEAEAAGADIAKVAVMPKNYQDVLSLMSATNMARNERVQVPIITISMGSEGAVSRLAGGLFGSDISFAIGKKASAPGQIPIKDLKAGMNLLYPDS